MVAVHFPSTTSKYLSVDEPNTMHESVDAVLPKYIVQQFIWPTAADADAYSKREALAPSQDAPSKMDVGENHVAYDTTVIRKGKFDVPKGLPPGM